MEISKSTGNGRFGSLFMEIPVPLNGNTLKLTGYIKSQDVANGFAGLWIRVQGEDEKVVDFDNMQNRGITGSSDWKEYSIEVSYDPKISSKIYIGSFLAGDGKIWIDNLHLFVDGKPIEDVPLKQIMAARNSIDPATKTKILIGSEILSRNYSAAKIDQLADLCKIWGFLKYYHPAVGKGRYNWDSTLFSILPEIITSSSRTVSLSEEKLINSLGAIPVCTSCQIYNASNVKMFPDYGGLFSKNDLSPAIIGKLTFIRDNHLEDTNNVYINCGKYW
jgi:hypothetical protein